MIAKQELLQLRTEWQLDIGVIEKDYVLGWMLAAITAEPALAEHWIFKGGTCLRKCYYETYRLKVEIDYRAEQGRSGPRVVEPYSLRRTQDGNLVLFVVNDHDQLRSYRVDRIAGIRPTTTSFTPRYAVEF
jgi:predicted nucleotidyltransferase component of viral defense system